MSTAAHTKLAGYRVSNAQPITALEKQSITVARYSGPSPVLISVMSRSQ
jgi:hypothetical protein